MKCRVDSLEKTLMLGKIESKRREQQRMGWLDSITDSVVMNLSKLEDSEGQRSLVCRSPRCHKQLDTTQRLNNYKASSMRYQPVLAKSMNSETKTTWIQISTPSQFGMSTDRASLVAHLVKNPHAMWETWVRSLGWEGMFMTFVHLSFVISSTG